MVTVVGQPFGALDLEARDSAVYIISIAVFALFALMTAFLVQRRRSNLNWYEKNLLEVISTQPNYVRCRAMPRLDTNDNEEMPLSTTTTVAGQSYDYRSHSPNSWQQKQSRIQPLDRHNNNNNNNSGNSAEAAASSSSSAAVGGMTAARDLTQIFTVPKISKPANSMFKNYDQNQIDRGLYQTTMDSESNYNEELIGCCGSIKLSLFMDSNLNLLRVALKECVDLVAKRQDGYPNPYFKVSVEMPDSCVPKVEQQTKIIKNTASPTIDEEFFFQITNGNVSQYRLEILVFDYDQFSVDECIGYCWLTLGRLTVSTNKIQPTVFWAEVLPFDDDNGQGFGEVLFSVTYLSKAQRLTVNVFKARNLYTETSDNLSSTAIRISVFSGNEKRLKRKRTSSKRNTRNPQFNESLTFGIPKNSLCDSVLEIEAINEYGTFGMGCKVLGKLELPLHKCRDLWRAIIREEKSQARWYSFEEP